MEVGLSPWVPSTYIGDPDEDPDVWLWFGSAPPDMAIWGMNQRNERSLILFVPLGNTTIHIKCCEFKTKQKHKIRHCPVNASFLDSPCSSLMYLLFKRINFLFFPMRSIGIPQTKQSCILKLCINLWDSNNIPMEFLPTKPSLELKILNSGSTTYF